MKYNNIVKLMMIVSVMNFFFCTGEESMLSDEKTQCQHVICTRPLADCKPCPVRGLAVIPVNAATTSLVCMLADYSCMQVAIR